MLGMTSIPVIWSPSNHVTLYIYIYWVTNEYYGRRVGLGRELAVNVGLDFDELLMNGLG